ncbi:hypothetical protein IQ13_2651 [Lacibacter cauensis]|uniref:Uncharacterized protein n=1 Tax=Lacibacter cauensis TaxID=510947 RepID=A0A562SKJ6_9BACT|nr:hypothetical protein [Lacibacter cauensis]TWI81633.1 hypothetical protein IQ13_2651 [Lacibacter cauensis]
MFITRKAIVQSKPIVGSEITKLQKAFFDEELLQEYKQDGEEQLYRDMFDCVHDATAEYKTSNSIIGLDHTDINSYTTVLSNKLKELFQAIGADEVYILSHLKLDLFGNRDNQFKPLAKAYEKLEAITGQTSYKEAFHININQLQQFIDIIFWLIRCDPAVPEYIFFFAGNEKLELFLCKYGNIHLTEIGNVQLTKEVLAAMGWQVIDGPEYDRFSNDGAIEGRQINL